MGEFEFITEHLTQLCGPQALNLKDDIAVWTPPIGQDAIISMDTIVEGVHFPNGKFDAQLAQKLIRVNVSDIIAKGADPLGYFLSLCLPEHVGEKHLKQFCNGLAIDQEKYGLKLWGGDTTRSRGTCVLSLTIIGTVPHKKAVLRKGANVGDIICVSGTIGDAYLGLQAVSGKIKPSKYLKKAYHLPDPPFHIRRQIRDFASAALDISDGLIADAAHLAKSSGVGIRIDLPEIPLSSEAEKWVAEQENQMDALKLLVSGGDDYQVLMAIPEDKYEIALEQGMQAAKIGIVTNGCSVACFDENGREITMSKSGYTHF